MPGLSFLHNVPREAPENVPGAVVGGILLVVARREKIVKMAIRTRLSLGMVFGKQAV